MFHLDDKRGTYIWHAQSCFEALQEVAGRIAGLLLVAEMRDASRILDTGSFEVATRLITDADRHFAMLVPALEDQHFHDHLNHGLDAIRASVTEVGKMQTGIITRVDPLTALQMGWTQLVAASRLLPGFPTVDFRQSCCAAHQIKKSNYLGG